MDSGGGGIGDGGGIDDGDLSGGSLGGSSRSGGGRRMPQMDRFKVWMEVRLASPEAQ